MASETWPVEGLLEQGQGHSLDEVLQAELRGRYGARHLAEIGQDECKEPANEY